MRPARRGEARRLEGRRREIDRKAGFRRGFEPTDSAADPAAPPAQDAAAATTPDPVAVPIAAAAAPTAAPAATPASGNATAPLAIAAAAIAAAHRRGRCIRPDQNRSRRSRRRPPARPPIAAAKTDAQADGKRGYRRVRGCSRRRQPTPAATTDGAGSGRCRRSRRKPRTPVKAPVAQTGDRGIRRSRDAAPVSADPSATATSTGDARQQRRAATGRAGKPKAGHGVVDAAKADGVRRRRAGIGGPRSGRAQRIRRRWRHASDRSGVQAAGTIQPQLHAGSAARPPPDPSSVTAATDAAVPLSGLAVEIAASAQSGKSRFEIRLDPAELGRIDVRIDVDRNGQVTSHLMVEKPETLSMLRQDAAAAAARARRRRAARPAMAACSSACATSLHPVRTTAANPAAMRSA